MSYPIENKLVIGVASSALFKLDQADEIYRTQGIVAYRQYQREHQNDILQKGIAFPFIHRLLNLNSLLSENGVNLIEVVLLSHNDPDTGLRVFHSIEHYGLQIQRAAFTTGDSPFQYIPAYNVSLFLSANEQDVSESMAEGYAAGLVLNSTLNDNSNDNELRIAFDFDGVIADSEAEKIYQTDGLKAFQKSEIANANIPHPPGPLADLFTKLSQIRNIENMLCEKNHQYKRYLKTAIVTARSAPAHERLITTLRSWNITVDQTFFLGGLDKGRILSILRPHIFFDDQQNPHLDAARKFTPSVHIPFGFKAK